MYLEMIYRPRAMADQVIYPDHARKLVAKACDGFGIPTIFNRDQDGKSISLVYERERPGIWYGVPPAIAFDGGKGFIRIYGIGQEGKEILGAHAAMLFSAIMRRHGLTAVEMKEGTCGIRQSPYVIPHRIRRLLVAKKLASSRYTHAPVTEPEAVAAIRYAVVSGLVSQARLLGDRHAESMIPREEDVDVLDGAPLLVNISGEKNYAAGYKNVVVGLPLRLRGPWQCGHLKSRGYGFIRPVDPMMGRRE
ncbi:hypothetical protein HAP93_10915 [Acidithiobacillus ferriphilus]|uniref:hypothetical protein n=1 Tax=Acidithiobacillus ferriphilus TaxID=1689834 RepID=UPI001C05F06E|nr:hypothetical protein [Acidithiobacillus ferriphilus]MBU2786265.1 hypothetical protein [Acidithiobacillus ferriphilus]